MAAKDKVKLVTGMQACMDIITQSMELRAQTARVKNILTSNDLDAIMVTCIVALKDFNKELHEALEK